MPVVPAKHNIRTPQARVLRALMPIDPSKFWTEWPLYNRTTLASEAGFNPTTGTINRVLNGIPEGSSSGEPHLGLLALGYLKKTQLDTTGMGDLEDNYRISASGIKAYERFIANGGKIPAMRDKTLCVNDRYQE